MRRVLVLVFAGAFCATAYAEGDPAAVVEDFNRALEAGDQIAARAFLGETLTMFNGAGSSDPSKWEAHLYLEGTDLDEWIGFYVSEAGPHEIKTHPQSVSERGNLALVVMRESGRNRFRTWKDETSVWLVATSGGAWKIVGMFLKDAKNPE